MKRQFGMLLLLLVGAGRWVHGEDPVPDDSTRLEGRWKVVALESEGRKATAAELEAMKEGAWVFKADRVSFVDPRTPEVTSVFKVRPGKDPKEIDLTGLEGAQKGKTMEGIYKLEKDRLTICLRDLASASMKRPRDFATEAGSGLGMIVLERAGR